MGTQHEQVGLVVAGVFVDQPRRFALFDVETDVLALSVPDSPGAMYEALTALAASEVMIEYSYGFVSPINGEATCILRCDDQEKALGCLTSKGFKLLTAEEIK